MSSKNWLRFLAAGLIWSTSFLWIKIALQEVGPFMLVAFRATFATLGMLAIILFSNRKNLNWQTIKPWLGTFLLIGISNVVFPFVLISWGEQFIPSGIASVLNSTTPLFTILMVTFFLQEDRLNWGKAAGLLLGFSGVVILFIPELHNSHVDNMMGLFAILAASSCYAFSGILIKKKVHGLDSELQVFLQYTFAAMIVWLLVPVFESPVILPTQSLTWIALLWLGILGSSVASYFYFRLLHSAGPTSASTVTYIPPLVGLLLGNIFLSEPLGWQSLAGGVLIVAGIMLVNRKATPH
jgi:drug/metabolite transporter (DMT)-like permease